MFAHMEKMTAAAAQAADAPSCPFCPAEILMGTTFVVSIFVALSALVSIIGSIAVIIISAIIIILSAVIICVITPAEYRPNKALEPLI